MLKLVTKSYCPYCHAAKDLFDSLSATYENIDVTQDEELFDTIQKVTGSHTVPQIFLWSIKKESFLGGYSDVSALHWEWKLLEIINR